ncbi:LysR family transcriptional regulator [Solihabitans fulvus]|uniref:LysR family transcriptional regulator n=1 Tax=Solihabitans fulvus TaxID=1892852 RepID=A0A5B2WQ21_9PSEU|nr:LysR family transcriptional regulator [Solihabitans fulvus]KAA2253841.1 LysR family transcriptional regulator [Solihabitans fulvus]
MDPHLLRTFVAVTRLGSFSAAARELGYTQSAVSQHIAALEADLRAPLLHRRPVGPTEAGARLLDHAAPILLRLDAARADVARVLGEPPGRLTVGASPLAAPDRLATALARLRRSLPGLEVTLRVAGRAATVAAVAAGDLTLGLVDGVAAPSDPLRLADPGPLTTVAVAEETLVVLLPPGHPLGGRAGLRLGDLVSARWIDAPETAAPLADLRAATESDGVRAGIRYEGTDTATLLALVAGGHGLAVLPASAARESAGVVAVAVLAPRLVHRTELVHGHLAGPAATALADALRHGT